MANCTICGKKNKDGITPAVCMHCDQMGFGGVWKRGDVVLNKGNAPRSKGGDR